MCKLVHLAVVNGGRGMDNYRGVQPPIAMYLIIGNHCKDLQASCKASLVIASGLHMIISVQVLTSRSQVNHT